MTTLDDIADAERPAMRDAASQLGLDTSGSRLVSASSRLIWHLPVDQVAFTITRPGSKTADDIGAEVAAVHSATAGGVRTPPLLTEPTELANSRFALPYRWIKGRAFQPKDWPAGVVEAAKLAQCKQAGLRRLTWPAGWPDTAWKAILGQRLFAEFVEHLHHAEHVLDELLSRDNLALCHGDLQPTNFLVDEAGTLWLIDLEYACLAPPAWDAAKLVLLASRFGDPSTTNDLVHAWATGDRLEVELCVLAQEVLIIGWLLRMARQDAAHVEQEARARAGSVVNHQQQWHHLRAR